MTNRQASPISRADVFFWVLSAFVLLVLVGGLSLRVEPSVMEKLGISLEESLIPMHYLDLVGLALFLLLLYAALKRWEVGRLRLSLTDKVTKARRIHLELKELGSIFEVSSRVNSFHDVEEALQFIAHAARECLNADRSTVFLVEDDRLVIRAASGRELDQVENVSMSMGSGVAGWVAMHRQPLLLNGAGDLASFVVDAEPDRSISSALCVPFILKGETLGVLNVNRLENEEKGQFQERHLKLLSIFADYAASTINNLRMYRQVASAHSRMERSYREMKQVQDQLIQAEKMAAIGQLISEVSHELNNPLTTAVGYAQLLAKVNEDPEIAEYLQIIRDEGMRCQRIIQNLLDFARKNEGLASLVDVNTLIRKTVDLRKYQLSLVGVEVELDLEQTVPMSLADPSLLQQVFLNVVNNAEQAIAQQGGTGTIWIRSRVLPGGDRVEVRIEDSGPGIPEGMEEKIFEPFCTTKPSGKGTGLGLSVCRGILAEVDGEIHAARGAKGGALFTIRVPADGAPTREEQGEHRGQEVVRGKRILVVDDQEQVRQLLTRSLVLDQHHVASVSSAEEALDMLDSAEFDLVLTDVRMPGKSGIDLYHEVRSRDLKAASRVMFFTGAALGQEYAEFFERTGAVLLQKPFQLDDVRSKIRIALEPEERVAVAEIEAETTLPES